MTLCCALEAQCSGEAGDVMRISIKVEARRKDGQDMILLRAVHTPYIFSARVSYFTWCSTISGQIQQVCRYTAVRMMAGPGEMASRSRLQLTVFAHTANVDSDISSNSPYDHEIVRIDVRWVGFNCIV